jgi:hypothetical protein
VIPAWAARVAHVSPDLAVTLRVHAAAAWLVKPNAKSKRLLATDRATMVTSGLVVRAGGCQGKVV